MDINFDAIEIPEIDVYGLHSRLLSDACTQRVYHPEVFHREITPSALITNQKASGRCWIFAGLNMLRRSVIKTHKLPSNFEFSQSYVFFWDKLERMNYLIDTIVELRSIGCSLEDRTVNFLMKDPFGDGGQWSMFANIVAKYGVVPKSAYPESFHTSNSRGVNHVLCMMFRNYISKMYSGEDISKRKFLIKTYRVLVRFFGRPPSDFVFETKTGEEVITRRFTPQEFKDFCDIDLSRYVSIVNDPRNMGGQLYTIDRLNNVVDGEIVKYLNLPVERLEELTKASLDANYPVWFGSDVGQYFARNKDVLDEGTVPFDRYLDLDISMTKRDRIETAGSIPGHAMVYTGYHLDEAGEIDFWKIENSWGKRGRYDGYLVCSKQWFRDYSFQIVVDRSLLTEEELHIWNEAEINVLPIWDPLGTLA